MERRPIWQTVLLYAIVVFWSFLVLFPFYWLATTSFKKPLDAIRSPKYIPYEEFEPTIEHWEYLLKTRKDATWRHFRNSLIAASGSTALAVLIGSMAGYGLSRFRYYWNRLRWRNEVPACGARSACG